MASIREIKRRKLSIANTQQITKAMKLVSTAKLQKAKHQAESTRPYFLNVHTTISTILAKSSGVSHPFLEDRKGNKNLYIVITSNRGLAGGYNNNVGKLTVNHLQPGFEGKVIAIGKKGAEYLRKRHMNVIASHNDILDDPTYGKASKISDQALELYMKGEVDNIYISYTHFQSTLVQEAKLLKMIPVSTDEFKDEKGTSMMDFEPSAEFVLERILPKYLSSIIYGALKESAASEHGARMNAMDSATNNATEMIDKLSLKYNRARQSAITQEITEIVGGAEALQ
ncbi:MAG: ATP synthase F1 subunit gamma [Vallitaleaceae bacterium]|jgi:F-type H+-transporting ATPase subunit gamma|nr:ATP synthase F1 subunit gamma [Vallitaleaceae bacterium]